MAKSSSKKSKHTHIPSHIGFSIIALVALVFGLILVTQYSASNQTETEQSEASGNPPQTSVSASKPVCISYNTSEKCLLYQQTTTKIPAKSTCISYNTSNKCTYYSGETQNTTTFVPTPVSNKPSTPKKQTSTTTKTTTTNYGQSSACSSVGGTCESTSNPSNKSGSFAQNLCPGPASWQCLVPNTGKSGGKTTGPGYVVCHNGNMVTVGGAFTKTPSSGLAQLCSKFPNVVIENGNVYNQ